MSTPDFNTYKSSAQGAISEDTQKFEFQVKQVLGMYQDIMNQNKLCLTTFSVDPPPPPTNTKFN
jgi:hypothetical protein